MSVSAGRETTVFRSFKHFGEVACYFPFFQIHQAEAAESRSIDDCPAGSKTVHLI